ncbi:MAG: endolytic transglycosylase MltG [Bryobacterales bacterium]|nr:endolytic transglycosylase MltG [Bryobacterales bacterium]
MSRNSRRRFLQTTTLVSVLGISIVGCLAGYRYLGPYQGFTSQRFIEVKHGMSSRAIGRELARQGVVRSEWSFFVVRLLHPTAKLQAGEYRFASAQTPWKVFDVIRRGQIFYEEFTIPEGSSIFDISGLLRTSDTIPPDEFLKAAGNPENIRDLDPLAPSLEGFLFPSTYRVTHKSTAAQLCRMMTNEFRKQWAMLAGGSSGTDVHRVVTLASLVEKETAVSQERPLVAAVFFNRLQKGIPLQCDPTTVYAALLENRYSGVIHKSDLANTNPYNTYAHPGLPPGPITNPGIASLKAVLQPANSSFLYFVAKPDGSGSHHFSASLDEHEKAVASYRKGHP